MLETSKIRKNYMYVSIAMLLMAIYVIFFPLIDQMLNLVSPGLTKCAYLQMTGEPCPLCGGTRYIKNIGTAFHDITYLFHPFGVIMVGIVFEVLFRVFCLIQIKRKKPLKKIMIFDIVIHTIMIIAFIGYEISFMYFK